MQFAAGIAYILYQAGFDVHVDIFQFRLELEIALLYLLKD